MQCELLLRGVLTYYVLVDVRLAGLALHVNPLPEFSRRENTRPAPGNPVQEVTQIDVMIQLHSTETFQCGRGYFHCVLHWINVVFWNILQNHRGPKRFLTGIRSHSVGLETVRDHLLQVFYASAVGNRPFFQCIVWSSYLPV